MGCDDFWSVNGEDLTLTKKTNNMNTKRDRAIELIRAFLAVEQSSSPGIQSHLTKKLNDEMLAHGTDEYEDIHRGIQYLIDIVTLNLWDPDKDIEFLERIRNHREDRMMMRRDDTEIKELKSKLQEQEEKISELELKISKLWNKSAKSEIRYK